MDMYPSAGKTNQMWYYAGNGHQMLYCVKNRIKSRKTLKDRNTGKKKKIKETSGELETPAIIMYVLES